MQSGGVEQENVQLKQHKQQLLDRLALYRSTTLGPTGSGAVQRLFEAFKDTQKDEIDGPAFKELAWALGEDLSQADALACIARLDSDRSGGLSLAELHSWWSSLQKQSEKDAQKEDAMLSVLLQRLHSASYVQMLLGWKEKFMKSLHARPMEVVADDHIFRFTIDSEVGEFGEARSSVRAHFTSDPDMATAAMKDLKAPSTCVAIASFAFTIRADIDEFELGELSGSLSNLLLLMKPVFKFHSHKTQMTTQNGERTMVLSLFWDDSDDALVQLQSGLIGTDLRELEGVIELSQKPGDQTDEFVMGRVRGKLAVGVNVVPYLNELLHSYKSDDYRAKVNMLAAFRNLDLKLKTENMEEAYRRFSSRIELLRDFRSLASLKQLILPITADLYNDNSVPAPIKDTYFAAIATLRGLASIHLQVNNQIIRLNFDSADLALLLPTKLELSNWKAPVSTATSATSTQNLRPLFGMGEIKFAIAGPPKVGKSSIAIRYTQAHFPEYVAWEDVYASDISHSVLYWARGVDAVLLVYSVTDRTSFEAMESWRKHILKHRNPTLILLGNKVDSDEQRKVSREEGEELARKWDNALFFEVSALTGANLEEAIMEALHELRNDDASADLGWYSALNC